MRKTWIEKIKLIDIGISVFALAVLILVTFLGVVFRYVFGNPFSWQEEVQLSLIIWVIFLGGRYAFETHSHVAIDMVVSMFPKKLQRVLSFIIAGIVTVVLICICVFGMEYIGIMYRYSIQTSILHLPYYLIYLPLPVSCVCMIIQFWANTLKEQKMIEVGEGER